MTFPYTPITNGDNRKNDAAIWNDVFSEFAAIIGNIAASGVSGTSAAEQLTYLKSRIDTIVASAGTSNTEIVDARGSESVLLDRINVVEAGKINVKAAAYGATGDGTTDDYAAFVAAIDAAPAGGEILIPQGTYVLSQTITVNKSIRLVGASPDADGGGTVLKPATSFTGTYLINIISDDVKVENMYLNCTNGASVVDGIYVQGTPSGSVNFIIGVELANLSIRNTNGIGITMYFAGISTIRNVISNSGAIVIDNDCTSINLVGCYVLNVANSGYRVAESRYISFSACAADNMDHYGYYVISTAESVAFVGCGAENNRRGGFKISGNACSVVSCFGVNNGADGDTSSYVASGVTINGNGNTVMSWHENDDTGAFVMGDILCNIYVGGDNNIVIGGTFERGAATDGVKVLASTVNNVIVNARNVDVSSRVASFGQNHHMRVSGSGTGINANLDIVGGNAGYSILNMGDTDDDDVFRLLADHTNSQMDVRAGTTDVALRVRANGISILDGVTAPTTQAGRAIIFVDGADGDLKVRFGDGTTKTIATDT